jgi:hypothetical protein
MRLAAHDPFSSSAYRFRGLISRAINSGRQLSETPSSMREVPYHPHSASDTHQLIPF